MGRLSSGSNVCMGRRFLGAQNRYGRAERWFSSAALVSRSAILCRCLHVCKLRICLIGR